MLTGSRTANAVARVENLEFLTDVVPKTMTFKQFKQKQAKDAANPQTNGAAANGQGTLDGHLGGAAREEQATNGAHAEAMEVDDDEEEEADDTQDADDQEGEREATHSPEPNVKGKSEEMEVEEQS